MKIIWICYFSVAVVCVFAVHHVQRIWQEEEEVACDHVFCVIYCHVCYTDNILLCDTSHWLCCLPLFKLYPVHKRLLFQSWISTRRCISFTVPYYTSQLIDVQYYYNWSRFDIKNLYGHALFFNFVQRHPNDIISQLYYWIIFFHIPTFWCQKFYNHIFLYLLLLVFA